MDDRSQKARSETMRRVRSGNTQPEMVVRRSAHAIGFRYRLHRRDLPGSPDLVFPRHRAVIFVHGCFWHMHGCRSGQKKPKTNAHYWQVKRERNKRRDIRVKRQLRRQGWRVLTVWECETTPSRREALVRRLCRFFDM